MLKKIASPEQKITMSDDELKALVAQLAMAQAKTDAQLAKTDAQLAKTDAQLAKTDAKLAKLAELYGGMGNNQGKVAEEFFFNSLKHNLMLDGMRFEWIERNVNRYRDGIEDEYDLLLKNENEIFVIEVKYHLHPNDIERVITRKIPNFQKLFPEYAHSRQHWGIATFAVEDATKRLALEQGLMILQRRGNIITTTAAASR